MSWEVNIAHYSFSFPPRASMSECVKYFIYCEFVISDNLELNEAVWAWAARLNTKLQLINLYDDVSVGRCHQCSGGSAWQQSPSSEQCRGREIVSSGGWLIHHSSGRQQSHNNNTTTAGRVQALNSSSLHLDLINYSLVTHENGIVSGCYDINLDFISHFSVLNPVKLIFKTMI